MKEICNKCKKQGFCFKRTNYTPLEFIEGNPKAPIWIIAINPKKPINDEIKRYQNETKIDLEKRFEEEKINKFFDNYKRVSLILYERLKSGKVAHTELVKCWSEENWNQVKRSNQIKAIENCLPYLKKQIIKFHPKIILCNGIDVSESIKTIITTKKDSTSYAGSLDGNDFTIILSGFIGQMDTYSKKRLGKEIENLILEMDTKR